MSGVPASARRLGASLVVAAILFQSLWLGLPAIFLSIALVVCYVLWKATPWQVTTGLRTACMVAIAVFLAHAGEEYLAGMQVSLPALFGRAPWSDFRFLTFNAVWAGSFVIAAWTLRPGRTVPVLVVLFLALAGGVGNGVLHLLLVVRQGSYFPGAWTAPLCLGVGVWLLRWLYRPRVPA